MEQFIGCDAHKKFSVFVAVDEKGRAGEALRLFTIGRPFREFLARLPSRSEIAVEASGTTVGWSTRWNDQDTAPGCAIRWRPSGGWG